MEVIVIVVCIGMSFCIVVVCGVIIVVDGWRWR